MKRFFAKSLALIMIVAISVGVHASCNSNAGHTQEPDMGYTQESKVEHTGDSVTEHPHEFSNTYFFDADNHWKVCACGAKSNEGAHTGGEATCNFRAVCTVCDQIYGALGHDWNDGELITPATESESGTVRYTCKECFATADETVPAGTQILTRADIEEALVSVAWAYYVKGTKIQYDSSSLTKIGGHYGGICRFTRDVSPEFGTSDTTIYSVCTGVPAKIYLEAIGRRIWETQFTPNGVVTMWFWVAADNQSEEGFRDYYKTQADPITENDRDTAIVRWSDYAQYLQDESDELSYAQSLGTFESTSFVDWYSAGTLEYRKAEGEELYSYYLDGKKITPAAAKDLLMAYLSEKKDGEYVNVRPGDVIVEDGHAFIYIGNGYTLDCKGFRYDMSTGVDGTESAGALAGEMRTLQTTLTRAASDYIISRPLDYYTKDYDGDPANDIIKFNGEAVEISEATKSRMEYPAMEIDRTVDITPYGTAEKGGTLTYTVKVSNKSDDANYRKWMRVDDAAYAAVNYKGVVISEKIPQGTELVSVSEGCTFVNGVPTWTVDINASETVEIRYTVRVIAEVGSVITSDGGMVAGIPSNSISNQVGYAKMTDAQKNTLTEIAQSNPQKWASTYGTDLAFAESIYARLGIDLDLPTVEELIQNLFTPTLIQTQISVTTYYQDKNEPVVMFVPSEEFSKEYATVRAMVLDRYWGGYRFFATDIEKLLEVGRDAYDFPTELDKTILEFDLDYLEVGDIIVYGTAQNRTNTGMTSKLASTRILIYVGQNTLIEMSSGGAGARYVGEKAQAVLDASFKNTTDIFFLLRPSQAIDVDTKI